MQKLTRPVLFLVLFLMTFVLTFSCAHNPTQTESPDALLNYACRPGMTNQTVTGTVWMKAQSKDASGQFPASILAKAPDHLKLEATNLLGQTQAVISIEGKNYSVDVMTSKGMKKQGQGHNSWGGIPLQWATDLFLGKIPCPDLSSPQNLKLSVSSSGDFTVQTPGGANIDPETFIYHFRTWDGHPWPESLHWERKGVFSNQVDFKFNDPDLKNNSPKKWEAKSPHGEVKVRWRDRQIQ
jgi:hypothetical protein